MAHSSQLTDHLHPSVTSFVQSNMAKQVIIGALEEAIGEYVLNIDKENLKIAALRGKIKLEKVQLDGDLLGSYILGSMGLSGFGILSCWAETVKITIPLKNLEKEPTRIEMRGCHLLCLPLLPSTAHKPCGAGTLSDPRCTLRTRAKRSKLARFEKNYMSGRIEDEGPVAKRILRAVKEVERDIKKKQKRRGSPSPKLRQGDDDPDDSSNFYSLVEDLGKSDGDMDSTTYQESASFLGGEEKSSKDPALSASVCSQDIPELPRDWKVKLREKIMRNLEASMHDIHVRCEVSEGGLDFCHPDYRKRKAFHRQNQPHQYDQRAFAFGATLDNFIVRTANDKWEIGSHEQKSKSVSTDHLGPNPYDARNNKVITWENFCMYWDDDPPFLISESPIIRSTELKISGDKFHSKLAAAMEALYKQQEPGAKIRDSLQGKKRTETSGTFPDRPHQYCWEGFNYQVRQKTSNRTEPGPVSCLAEFLPFVWNVKCRPHQYVQYQKLKSAMLSQQRFDTMVKQRPSESPKENPRGWWKYAIGCIISRPNARPWEDVLMISKSRDRYIELVKKKMENSAESSGFHGGLSESESNELVVMEDLLPIEALLSFHLVALRLYTKSPKAGRWRKKEKLPESPSRARSLTRPISRIFGGRSIRSLSRDGEKNKGAPLMVVKTKPPKTPQPPTTSSIGNASSMTLIEAVTVRIGRKIWMTNFKFLSGRVNIILLSASDREIVRLTCEATGSIKFMGQGKLDYFFDVTKFEVDDCQHHTGQTDKILVVQSGTDQDMDIPDDLSTDLSLSMSLPLHPTDSNPLTSFMDLPPFGVVCRLAASRRRGESTNLSFSAHPATLMWTRPCFDAVAEFFGAPSSALQTELTRHLRNAATPLARKAQLTFLSQSNFLLHINVAAPKVWVPFSSSSNDITGALFLDAGNFRMSCTKRENQPHSSWSIDASDIQVNFAKWGLSEVKQRVSSPIPFFAKAPSGSIDRVNSIIRPFQVHASSTVRDVDDALIDDSIISEGPVGCVDVLISPICLNLVDAEVIARAIGKWYSQGLLSMRGRVSERSHAMSSKDKHQKDIRRKDSERAEAASEPPRCLTVSVEKVEMALEGHSKVNYPDERSVGSLDASLYHGYAPAIRTYVVEVFNITTRRSRFKNFTSTKLLVNDVSIVQLRDASEYVPLKNRHEAEEPEYSILTRGSHKVQPTQRNLDEEKGLGFVEDSISHVLKASLYHDGVLHLDEVEVDIDPVVLRVTPTTLKDCAKGIKRIVELIHLMTREMERKVHEEGRKARRRDVIDGTCFGRLQ